MAQTSSESTVNEESQGAQGLDAFFRQDTGSATGAAPAATGIDSFFRQGAEAKRPAAPAARQIDTATIDAVAAREGLSPAQRRVMGALLGQESNSGSNPATSIDGARGAGQIMPDTFRQYAKPGEAIDNPDHNLSVMARIVKDLGAKSGDDPARIATGYFSGPGNINTGAGRAWRNDPPDGNGKRVSSYVSDVLARLTGSGSAQAAEPSAGPAKPAADPLANAPKWTAVIAKPEYQAMPDADKAAARAAYFQAFVEPNVPPEQRSAYRTWFDGEASKAEGAAKPGVWKSIKTAAGDVVDAVHESIAPTHKGGVMDGMPQGDRYVGDQYDASKVGFKPAIANRKALDAQLAAAAEPVLRAAAMAEPAAPAPITMADVAGNFENNMKAAGYGLGGGFAKLGKYAALLATVPSIARDKAAGDTAASDTMFENVVKPFDDAIKYYESGGAAQPQTVGTKIYSGLGDLAATLPAIIATGGGVNPGTKYMVDIAKYAFAQGMTREAVMALVKGSADTLGNAIVTMAPATIPSAFERYQKLTESGVDSTTAGKAAFADFATTTAMGALPLWKAGDVATRAVTGAVGGAGIAAGTTALQNQVLHAYPDQQQDPLDAGTLVAGAATGGVLAGALGHGKEGPVTVTRTGQQGLPPAAEPAFKGTTIDGETGRPVGEVDPNAPLIGARVEPQFGDKAPADIVAAQRAAPTPNVTPAAEVVAATAAAAVRQTPGAPTERDILDYATTRYQQLRSARDGESVKTVGEDGKAADVEQPGRGLSADETAELQALEQRRGDAAGIADMYGFDFGAPDRTAIDQAAHAAATSPLNALSEPTAAQKDAGNYTKGHVDLHGLDISIENPQGSVRSGVAPDGKEWSNALANHYGYIRKTMGADGDHVDTFVGPSPQSLRVFVVDQVDPSTGKYDEHKVMLGFNSQQEADAAYHANYEQGWAGRAAITETTMDQFKGWLKDGDTTKPFAPEAVANVSERPQVPEETPAEAGAQAAPAAEKPTHAQLIEQRDAAIADYKAAAVSGDESAAHVAEQRLAHAREQINAAHLEVAKQAQEQIARATAAKPKTEKEAIAKRAAASAAPAPGEFTAEQHNLTERAIKQGIIRPATLRGTHFRDGIVDATNGLERKSQKQSYLDGYTFALKATGKTAPTTSKKEPANAAQAHQAIKTEAQREEAPAAKPVAQLAPPRTEKEAKARKAAMKEIAAAPLETRSKAAPAPIEDFGETLAGARKHYAAAYADKIAAAGDLDIAKEPLSKTWPEPDYEKLIEGGAETWAVAFIHAARDAIPNKPSAAWKIKGWVERVSILRDFAHGILSGKYEKSELGSALIGGQSKPLSDELGGRVALYEQVGHAKSLKGISVSRGIYSVFEGKDVDPPRVIWTVEKSVKATALSNWPRDLASGATRDEAIADFKAKFSKLELEPPKEKIVTFDIYTSRAVPGKFIIGKKINGDYLELKRFDTVADARAYKAGHQNELEALLKDAKAIPPERKDTNAPRVGADHRGGADVTPEVFSNAFGFRGVQFGNYVEGTRRQQDLNDAYDALMDMAGVIGVPAKALSLGGELGLAFGARGKGGKNAPKAHYERGTIVINLTKSEGAGSLAHEWWHSLDNYFSRLRADKAGMATNYLPVGLSSRGSKYMLLNGDFRKEMVDAFGQVVRAVTTTGIRERSKTLDRRRTNDYWSTTPEMTARAFESYVINKLEDQGQSNDYLANIVPEAAFKIENGYPYATAAELPVVRAAFDAFFDAIETKDTDKGVVFNDLSGFAAGSLARLGEPVRVATLAKLKALERKLGAGKLTDSEFQLGIHQLIGSLEHRNDSKAPAERARGELWVRERLLRAKRTGELQPEAVDFALWALDQNPALANDLGVSLRHNAAGTAGNYNPAERVITLFKGSENAGTAVHEILHHSERMMPPSVQDGIVREWARAWDKAWKASEGDIRAALNDMLASSIGDRSASARVLKAFEDGVLKYDEHYPLVNASEFWAVHATDILSGRAGAARSWVERAKQWLREMWQKVKGLFGLASDAPVLAGLRAVMAGKGERLSRSMLSQLPTGEHLADLEKVSAYRKRSQFVDRWESDAGQPVFYGPKYDLMPVHEFDATSDLNDNPLQMGQAHMVEPGNRVYSFHILDKNQSQVGTAILQVDKAGDIVGIHDIEAIAKNHGMGTEVVRNIVASTTKPVAVIQVVPSAQKFWDSVGIYGQDQLYNHGSIDFASFAQSARGRAGRIAQEGGKGGQGRSEDGSGNEAPQRGNEGDGDVLNDIPNLTKRTEQSQAELVKEFGKPTFSNIDWWDKSVGTQFHKAEKNPHFKKVFDLAVHRENTISLATIRAAELAPAFLPRIDDFKSAIRTLVKGKKESKQQHLAADAIIGGTLHGENVLDGKVWDDAELRTLFGMDAHGVELYRQAREAIDASLDEVAAAEGFAALQMVLPRGTRERIIDDPRNARAILNDAIDKKISLDEMRARNMERKHAPEAAVNAANRDLQHAIDARETMEKVFRHVKLLKEAGYAPLMRFGKHFVSVEEVDPLTGKTVINPDTGAPNTLYFSRFETEGEAEAAYFRQQVTHRGDATVSVKSGPVNDEKYKMYAGVSPETIELFAEVVGAKDAMYKFYQVAVSERSALKRRLVRKSTAGYSQDMPRVLSNFVTSNGRHAAGRYYARDIGHAVKYIPREKGDVQKEAQRLVEYIDNPGEGGAMASSLAFTWFLGGNIASAVINATQPLMMTLPYLSQFGAAQAAAALVRATPYAMGRKQIVDAELRSALKRASQEGKVDAQEIFHLYSVGIQGVAGVLTNKLGKLPLVGGKVKGTSEDLRARITALGTLWGMPFAMVEGFNRRLSFLAAWDMAKQTNQPDPYDFAVKAVDATQGIYNKVNRPNWARSAPGRVIFTFAQFKIMNVELLKRMATMGGAEGKKAAAMYLAVLILAAGVMGLPYADDIDDLIDTVGQWLGYNTNMKRTKREWAYKTLGKGFGDLAMYGASSQLPLDFGGRMGLGNVVPATGLLKPSGENNRTQEFLELGGPVVSGLGKQVFDAYDAASMGDLGKATGSMMPTAIRNASAGLDMAASGKAVDMKGKVKTDATAVDAFSKSIGFSPTKVANINRANMPIQQDLALQKLTETNIVELWAQGAAKGDQDMMDKARLKMEDWNAKNPDTPVMISAHQIMAKARQDMTPADQRLMRSAPKEMRGHVAAGLDQNN
ncbi:MAG: PLxRFG domain-containing protein [Pseudomonadota bacterium]